MFLTQNIHLHLLTLSVIEEVLNSSSLFSLLSGKVSLGGTALTHNILNQVLIQLKFRSLRKASFEGHEDSYSSVIL